MRDVLWERMLAANLRHANVGGFACFGEGVVTAVKVFAFLIIWI